MGEAMTLSFTLFSFFLLLIVPGFIATWIYRVVCRGGVIPRYLFVSTALIFDLLILIVNLLGLFYLKGIRTLNRLIEAFECLQFTAKYGLLAIFVGAVLALIGCSIRCLFRRLSR